MENITLANPILINSGISRNRVPDSYRTLSVPSDMEIVSADGHYEISEDIFYENFPKHLREFAPRVWFDQFWRIGYREGLQAFGQGGARFVDAVTSSVTSGAWDLDLRFKQLDAEGVHKEIVFPQSLLGFIRYENREVQEWMYRIYNEHIASVSSLYPDKFFGVGILSNWWDQDRVTSAVQQIVDLGLKTFMLPVSPGKDDGGREITYGSVEMEPLWSAIAEAGLPVNFHVGENISSTEGRGALPAVIVNSFTTFAKPLSQLVFGGVFDRQPGLRVVFSEGGIAWIPPALQDMEMVYDTHRELVENIQLRPSEYWRRNCYASFQNDLLGLSQLEFIGADRVLWASDYPHSEGSLGVTQRSIESVAVAVGTTVAEGILGATARELYSI